MTAIAFFLRGTVRLGLLSASSESADVTEQICLFVLVLFCKKRDTAPALPYPACGGPAALLQGSSDCTKEGAARRRVHGRVCSVSH